jgi:holo-[acyl-carrier protein] synthase
MIGIDIVRIARIEAACKKAGFTARVFTPGETAYYRDSGGKAETLAGMYALKEAAAKALGTGFTDFGLKDIEVEHSDGGEPRVMFHGRAAEALKRTGRRTAYASISHDGEYAVAVCNLE